MRVTVFGANGGVGSRVVARLAAEGHEVVGVVRRDDAAEQVRASGATPLVIDVAVDPVDEALRGADAVVWAIGARFATDGPDGASRIDAAGGCRAVAAAAAAGLPRWVHVSSLLADRPEEGPPMLRAFLEAKNACDTALAATPMDWTVVRPSGLVDEPGRGTVLAAAHLAAEAWGGGRSPMVSRDDVADIVVAAVLTGAASRRAFDVVGGDVPIDRALADL